VAITVVASSPSWEGRDRGRWLTAGGGMAGGGHLDRAGAEQRL